MWWVMVSVAAIVVGTTTAIPCEEARMKCAYRVGCGMALQNYVVGCSGVLQGPPPTQCPEICQHSLIALTSTEEGKDLMNCDCNDDYCEDQKLRSEICRPQVMKSINEPIVSCRIAQWICAADALCSTALDYYNRYCRAMFHGKKCTPRCINSISILRRQEKAAKLTTCKCDDLEDYDCRGIQKNMEKLCFHKHSTHHHQNNQTINHQHNVSGNSGTNSNRGGGGGGDEVGGNNNGEGDGRNEEPIQTPTQSPPSPPRVFMNSAEGVKQRFYGILVTILVNVLITRVT